MFEKGFERPLARHRNGHRCKGGVGIFPTWPVSTCRWKRCVSPHGISSSSRSVFGSPPRPADPPAVLRLTVRSLAEPADDPEDVERVDDLDVRSNEPHPDRVAHQARDVMDIERRH
jgi:hypothetical protein